MARYGRECTSAKYADKWKLVMLEPYKSLDALCEDEFEEASWKALAEDNNDLAHNLDVSNNYIVISDPHKRDKVQFLSRRVYNACILYLKICRHLERNGLFQKIKKWWLKCIISNKITKEIPINYTEKRVLTTHY